MAVLLNLSNEILEIIITLLMGRNKGYLPDRDQFYGSGKVLRLTHPRLRALVDPILFGNMMMRLDHTDPNGAERLWQKLTGQTISRNIRMLNLHSRIGREGKCAHEEIMQAQVESASKLARRFLTLHQTNQSLAEDLNNTSRLAFPHLWWVWAQGLPTSLLVPFLAPFTSVLSNVEISSTSLSSFPHLPQYPIRYQLNLPLLELPPLHLRSVSLNPVDHFDWMTELLAQWPVHIESLAMKTWDVGPQNASPLQIYRTVKDVAARSPNFASFYYSTQGESVYPMLMLKHALLDVLLKRLCVVDFAGKGIKAKVDLLVLDWEQRFVAARAAGTQVLLSDVMETKEITT